MDYVGIVLLRAEEAAVRKGAEAAIRRSHAKKQDTRKRNRVSVHGATGVLYACVTLGCT